MNRERQLGALQILLEDMRTVLEDLLPSAPETLGPVELPAVDFLETQSHLLVRMDLPGVDPEGIQVHIVRDHLIVRGTKQEPPVPGKVTFLCMERSFGPFLRIIALGKPIHPEKVSATYHQGSLVVKMEKITERRGRPITIPVGSPGGDNQAENDKE
jgi:HSP20 family protein